MKPNAIAAAVTLYRRIIPTFECIPGCTDCCGPIPALDWEVDQLPKVQPNAAAEAGINCPYKTASGCSVYTDRPLICRLFGTVPKMVCPKGKGPERMLSATTESEIVRFLSKTPTTLIMK